MLCDPEDRVGRWAADGLEQRGCSPVLLLTAADLVALPGWTHRLHAEKPSFRLELPDGRAVDDAGVAGVLNRLTWVPPWLLAGTHADDREYAAQELGALLLSWLHGIAAPVLNRPTTNGLGGRWRFAAEWALLAARAGFTVPRLQLGTGAAATKPDRREAPEWRHVVVIGESILGAADDAEDVQIACRRLAAAAGTALLGIDVYREDDGRWCFAGAGPLPDLTQAGDAALDALAAALGAPEKVAA